VLLPRPLGSTRISPNEADLAAETGTAVAEAAAQRRPTLRVLVRPLRNYRIETAMLLVLVVLACAMEARSTVSLSGANIRNVLDSAAPLLLVSIGQLLVLITGGIDLSVGAAFALVGMTTAVLMQSHGIGVSVVVGTATGLALGLANGLLIVYLKLAPFIVTLATLSIGGSLAYVVSGGTTRLVPDAFASLDGGTLIGGIPNYVTVMVVALVIVHLFLRRTVFGRYLYATGSSEQAARLAGVPSELARLFAYAASGLLAAVAAFLAMSQLGAVDPSSGSSTLLLNSIAAVVIGGASLFGGLGSAPGALIGVLIISLLQNALVILQVPSFWQGTMSGGVIVFAVLIERLVRGGGGGERRIKRGLFTRKASTTKGRTPTP
jgi:ribose transport system permease protein